VDALGQDKLKQLNIQNFKDYVQALPSVTMAASIGAGSGFSAVYMRGIATGGDGQATTSQPSVGMYLDEQPITTIQGNLDVHLYDIARVEALAVRRARCTARARRRARSASSRTSRTRQALRPASRPRRTWSTATTAATSREAS
jgi:hypothetical protein